MPYYSLRITPEEISKDAAPKAYKHLFRDMIKQYQLSVWALAWEKLNKYLEDCKPHYHFNFITEAPKPTIRAFITRWSDFGQIKGKNAYSLSAYTEPDDASRWWRYCFKERCLEHSGLDALYDISNISLLAVDERKRSSLWNIEKRENLEKKTSQYCRYEKKVEAYAKKNNVNQQIIFCKFLELCISDNKTINHKQLLGWTHLYLLKHNFMTPVDYYKLYLPR